MDKAVIRRVLKRRLGLERTWGEACAILAGMGASLLLIAVVVTLVYLCLVYDGSFHSERPVSGFDTRLWGCLMVGGVLLSMLAARASGRYALENVLPSTAPRVRPGSRYASGELLASGCVVSLSRFLGGNILVCLAYFLGPSPLSRRQWSLAVALVSHCLATSGEVGVDRLHDALLNLGGSGFEADFETVLAFLRRRSVLQGTSYVQLSDEVRTDLLAAPTSF